MPVEKNSLQSDQVGPVQHDHVGRVQGNQVERVQGIHAERVHGNQAERLQGNQEDPGQHDPVEQGQQYQEQPIKNDQEQPVQSKRTLKSLVNTPLKRVMFGIQILSYVLIVGSPAIGGLIGKMLELKTGATAGVILGVFIAGEVLFYSSLAFLGKELILLLKNRVSGLFRKKR